MSSQTTDLSKRRRFQPPITTFFTAATGSDPTVCAPHLSHTHYSAATSSPTPAVPAKVQASLLSVGMRVRKSVAEGYKTQLSKSESSSSNSSSKPSLYSNNTPVVTCSTTYTELAPFCGTTKSGNEYQGKESRMDELVTDDGDAFSLPPSSQESVESVVPVSGHKRSYDSDEEEEDIGFADYAGTPWQRAGRAILTPKLGQQRRRFVPVRTQNSLDIDEFEEPTFLRRREEVDMDLS
ncbi:ribonucleotide reductase inhibitor-domain-containing protein [Aspergillus avenaceus]|uniref:Ribonucleotide reductase inhibitor-domain-containing protein n=1 Tax=Aspergillus avenaceus TaxID=36643 RepID=A0A5N6TX50_ASPAV|nr:ribonucleotide reductase inhibitor-domain-containing protein [Aspergillus avenaceus]